MTVMCEVTSLQINFGQQSRTATVEAGGSILGEGRLAGGDEHMLVGAGLARASPLPQSGSESWDAAL